MRTTTSFLASILTACLLHSASALAAEQERIRVSDDGRGFVLVESGKSFRPWGFNYDHDEQGRLIEDYWDKEWAKVEEDFREMKDLGANVVRIHLQFGKFMEAADTPNETALAVLGKLVGTAEKLGLYLDLTGLACYHMQDVPDWYDTLDEQGRWDAQARFWEAVARRCGNSPAIFCYDLMNEPVVPGGKRKEGDWLGPAFAGKHFVQVITLDQKDRPRPEIARNWIGRLVAAIRKHDRQHLVTVGLVDWSLDRPGLTSGFVPEKISGDLDFLCVHIYPEQGKPDDAIKTLAGFSVGKPILIEETFPLKCSMDEFAQFVNRSEKHACGWIGFYWGKPPEELRRSKEIKDLLLLGWLDFFANESRARAKAALAAQIDTLKKLGARITLDDQNRVISVNLGERMVTDADLVHLRGLQHLQELDLTRTRITGTGLANVKDLSGLTKLFLTDTNVDDASVAHLKGMKNLKLVGLSGTRIGDAGLDHLRELTGLKQLFCLGTSVTDAGVGKLQQALPQCQITH